MYKTTKINFFYLIFSILFILLLLSLLLLLLLSSPLSLEEDTLSPILRILIENIATTWGFLYILSDKAYGELGT